MYSKIYTTLGYVVSQVLQHLGTKVQKDCVDFQLQDVSPRGFRRDH